MVTTQDLVKHYMLATKGCMNNISPILRGKIQNIINTDADCIRNKKNISGLPDLDDMIIPVIQDGRVPLPFSEMDFCVIKHIAIGTAIAAAWVASEETLAVGSVVEGVVVNDLMVAALTNGASGADLATIICE